MIQILLIENVPKIGKKGDIVTVSDGYGRNFLIRKHMGVIPTSQDIAKYKAQIDKAHYTEQARIQELQQLKEKLEAYSITFTVKTNKEGHLFGAIKESDIILRIKDSFGISLDKSMIIIDHPIKAIGEYTVQVHLTPIIKTKIQLYVKSEIE